MDIFTVVSNIFVMVTLFIITCPNESNGYPRLDYDWAGESNPRFQSSWKRGRPLSGIEAIEEKRGNDNQEYITLPNKFRLNPDDTATIGPFPVPSSERGTSVCGDDKCLKEKKNVAEYLQKRLAHISGSQRNYLSEILFGGKPTTVIIWPSRA